MESEALDVHWHPDIDNWPYLGQNNVWGGGGEFQEADIVVPPNRNLYQAGVQDLPGVGRYLAVPTIALVVGLVLGVVLSDKIKKLGSDIKSKKYAADDDDADDVEDVDAEEDVDEEIIEE